MKLFVDVETTGFCPIRNDIISLGALIVDDNLQILDEFYQTVKAPINKFYSEEAEQIHGFNKEKITQHQLPKEFIKSFLIFLSPYKHKSYQRNQFCYHANSPFDWRFLDCFMKKHEREYDLYQYVDQFNLVNTMSIARQHLKGLGLKSFSLDNLSKHIGFELNHHHALSDCYGSYNVFKYCHEGLENGEMVVLL